MFYLNKNNIIKKITIIISIVLVLLIIYFSNNINSVKVISTEKQKNKIIENKTNKHFKIKYKNEEIPIYNDSYLITFITEKELIDNLSNEYNYVIYKKESYEEIIKNNQYIELIIYNEKYYNIKKVYLTTLSVININENKFTIFENLKEVNIKNTKLNYHIRGDSTQYSPKKSYKLNLSKKISMINMRNDDDWILNASHMDDSFIREKIGYDIWNEMSKINNHTLEYVEVFIDGKYQGLYYLQEPVDQHTYNLNTNETFYYSVKTWEQAKPLKIIFEESDIFANEFSFDKLDESKLNKSFETLNIFYQDLPNKKIDKVIYDENNLYNYEIFINLINSPDNTYKNQKFAIYEKNNKYYVTKTVWDLDLSMMNPKNYHFENDSEFILKDRVKNKYYDSNQNLKKQAKLYSKYREAFYNEQYILNIVNQYYNEILLSGSYIRNNEKWKISNDLFSKSIDIVKTSLINRIKLLDKYYGEYL